MDGISLGSDRIVSTGNSVTVIADALGVEIGTMTDLLGQIRGGWQSDTAAPRFAALLQVHLDQATQLKNALVTHGTSLVSVGQGFAAAESDLGTSLPAVTG
jgi:hypothetical protein